MTQIHKSRTSSHPFIDTVWKSHNLTDGVYLATPDGSWDIIVGFDVNNRPSGIIAGQATKPMRVPYTAGTRSVVVSFAAGVFMPQLPASELLDSVRPLNIIDDGHFELFGHIIPFPTFETAEEMVNEMVRLGILQHDDLVDSALRGTEKATSKRSSQRRFLKATGTTRKQLEQIERAKEAVRLLKQGKTPIEAAADAGYADQPHMAKSIKKIMHSKPSNVNDIHKL